MLKSHVLKQTKPTRKRMKQTLKKSQRFLAGKPVVQPGKFGLIGKKLNYSSNKIKMTIKLFEFKLTKC